VVDLKNFEEKCRNSKGFCREYILVHMQSGTAYEDFFSGFLRPLRVCNSSGLISYHWLRVLCV